MKQSPLYFTRAERRLLLAYSFICLIITSVSLPSKKEYSISRISLDSMAFGSQMSYDSECKIEANSSIKALTCDSIDPIPIGQVQVEHWMNWGAPKNLALRIQRYMEKGGRIQRPEDLMRIYDIDTAWVMMVSPCIEWETGSNTQAGRTRFAQRKNKDSAILDLNQADSAALVLLSGIGPVLSSRIVKFRDQLGGFYEIDQLSETYGLADSIYQRLKPNLEVKTAWKKLKINRMKAQEIVQHPYFSWKEAIAIERYRNSHGPFTQPQHFYKVKALDSSRIERWLPYMDLTSDP